MGVKAAEGLEEATHPCHASRGKPDGCGISYSAGETIVLQFWLWWQGVKEQTINLRYDRQQTSQPDLERVLGAKENSRAGYPLMKIIKRRSSIWEGVMHRNAEHFAGGTGKRQRLYHLPDRTTAELRDEYDRILKGTRTGTGPAPAGDG